MRILMASCALVAVILLASCASWVTYPTKAVLRGDKLIVYYSECHGQPCLVMLLSTENKHAPALQKQASVLSLSDPSRYIGSPHLVAYSQHPGLVEKLCGGPELDWYHRGGRFACVKLGPLGRKAVREQLRNGATVITGIGSGEPEEMHIDAYYSLPVVFAPLVPVWLVVCLLAVLALAALLAGLLLRARRTHPPVRTA